MYDCLEVRQVEGNNNSLMGFWPVVQLLAMAIRTIPRDMGRVARKSKKEAFWKSTTGRRPGST